MVFNGECTDQRRVGDYFTPQNCGIYQHLEGISDIPSEIAPSIWLGSYKHLCDSDFVNSKNFKIIINCSATYKFLNHLDASNISIPSDVVILSLDPSFSMAEFTEDESALLNEYVSRFDKILQNYISHFYKYNPDRANLIHKIPDNKDLSIGSPVLSGNLIQHLFSINRLIKLFKAINGSTEVFIVSVDGNRQLSTALCMSYLMDSYNFNLAASFNSMKFKRPTIHDFNTNYYNDLLIVESLKKFYHENCLLKQNSPGVLMKNHKLKRRNSDEIDDTTRTGVTDPQGERKRRIKFPGRC